uniref:SEA domain-containing protein n=1 Tax=Fundulus heteroclitus TaxID=8078 RepID=A0A3Q2PA00_FUNHE
MAGSLDSDRLSFRKHSVLIRRRRNVLFPSGVKLCSQETFDQAVQHHLNFFHLRVCQETVWEAFKIFWDRLPDRDEYQAWVNRCIDGSVSIQDIGSFFSQSERPLFQCARRPCGRPSRSSGTGSRTGTIAEEVQIEDTPGTTATSSLRPGQEDIFENSLDTLLRPPRPLRDHVVELRIKLKGETYNDALRDPGSLEYQQLARHFKRKVEDAFERLPGFKSTFNVLPEGAAPLLSSAPCRGLVVQVHYAVILELEVDSGGISADTRDFITLQNNQVERSYLGAAEEPTVIYTITDFRNFITEALHKDNFLTNSSLDILDNGTWLVWNITGSSGELSSKTTASNQIEVLEEQHLEPRLSTTAAPIAQRLDHDLLVDEVFAVTTTTAPPDPTPAVASEPIISIALSPEKDSPFTRVSDSVPDDEDLFNHDEVTEVSTDSPPAEPTPEKAPSDSGDGSPAPSAADQHLDTTPEVSGAKAGPSEEARPPATRPETLGDEAVKPLDAEVEPSGWEGKAEVLEAGTESEILEDAEALEADVRPHGAGSDAEPSEIDSETLSVKAEASGGQRLAPQDNLDPLGRGEQPSGTKREAESPKEESQHSPVEVNHPGQELEISRPEVEPSGVPEERSEGEEALGKVQPPEGKIVGPVGEAVETSERNIDSSAREAEPSGDTPLASEGRTHLPGKDLEPSGQGSTPPVEHVEPSGEELRTPPGGAVEPSQEEGERSGPSHGTIVTEPSRGEVVSRIPPSSPPSQPKANRSSSAVEVQPSEHGFSDLPSIDVSFDLFHYGTGEADGESSGFSSEAQGSDLGALALPARPGRALTVFFSLRVTNMAFSMNLFNKSSSEYQALEQRFLQLLVPYLQSNLNNFQNLEILNFRNGSIVINSRMRFGKPVPQEVTNIIYLILEDFATTAYQTMNLAIDKYSLDVESGERADPCKFQACNEFSRCMVNQWSGEAECVCDAGYLSIDGLPCQSICDVQQDFCLNDGKCDIIPGKGAICRCRVGENWWYRGEHCEEYVSEPLVVGIAIASVAGFLLVAGGIIFFLARTLREQYDVFTYNKIIIELCSRDQRFADFVRQTQV